MSRLILTAQADSTRVVMKNKAFFVNTTPTVCDVDNDADTGCNYEIKLYGSINIEPGSYFEGSVCKFFQEYNNGGYNITGFENLDTSKATDFKYLFRNCNQLPTGISNWDVSNVTDFSYMFQGNGKDDARGDLDISGWDFGSAETMSYMFSNFGSGNIYGFDGSAATKVLNLSGLFSNTINVPDVSNMYTCTATNMARMFYSSGMTQDISNWKVPNIHPPNNSTNPNNPSYQFAKDTPLENDDSKQPQWLTECDDPNLVSKSFPVEVVDCGGSDVMFAVQRGNKLFSCSSINLKDTLQDGDKLVVRRGDVDYVYTVDMDYLLNL